METNSTPAPAPSADNDQRPADEGKIIQFRPRQRSAATGNAPETGRTVIGPEDLAKYEQGEGEDDYRHRMITNAAALVVTIILAATGAWLAMTIGDMRKSQDCYLSGRRNCTPIDVESLKPKAQPR